MMVERTLAGESAITVDTLITLDMFSVALVLGVCLHTGEEFAVFITIGVARDDLVPIALWS